MELVELSLYSLQWELGHLGGGEGGQQLRMRVEPLFLRKKLLQASSAGLCGIFASAL